MKMKKQTGFTLIELLVCTAIIGILAAFAIPAMTGKRPENAEGYSYTEYRASTPLPNKQGGATECINGALYARTSQGLEQIVEDGNPKSCI